MSEPIGQTTTTALILLVLSLSLAYTGMDWDGIERTRSAIGSVFGGGGRSLLLHKLIPAPFPVPTGSSWVSPSLLSFQSSGLTAPLALLEYFVPLLSVEWPNGSSTFPGLRPGLYEAETRPTYGSEAEPHPSNNGAA